MLDHMASEGAGNFAMVTLISAFATFRYKELSCGRGIHMLNRHAHSVGNIGVSVISKRNFSEFHSVTFAPSTKMLHFQKIWIRGCLRMRT